MADVETLRLRFTVDDSALDRVGKKATTASAGISGAFGKAARGVGVALAAVGVGKFVGDTVQAAATFDSTLRQMAAVADVPKAQLAELSKLALKMGADTSFSAQQAAQAMLELSKGGLSAAQIQAGALQATLTLAAAGGLELGNAATFMSNALNGFGLSAGQAGDVAAALAGAANASTASVESLGAALGQVGPGAKNAGLSLQDTVGVLAAFDQAGIKGSDAGTSLKTMLANLVPVTAKAKNAMADLGLKFEDAQGNIKPITQIAGQLQARLKGLSEAERIRALQTIFGSDATRAATVLMNEGAAGIAKYIKATKDKGAAEKAAKARTDGAAGAMEKLKGAYETVKIVIGTSILPAVASLASGLATGLTAGIDKAKEALNSLGNTQAFKKLKTEFDKVKEGFKTGGAKGGLSQIGASLESVLPPSVVSGIKGFVNFIKGVMVPALAGIGKAIGPAVVAFGKSLMPALKSLSNTFKNDVLPVIKAVAIVIGAVLFVALAKVLPVIIRLAGPVLGFLLKAIGFIIGRVFGFITMIGRIIGAFLKWATGTKSIGDALKVMAGNAAVAFSQIVKAVRFMLGIVLNAFGGIIHGAATAFGWLPGIGPKLKTAAAKFDGFKDAVLGALERTANKANGWGRATGNNFADGLIAATGRVKTSVHGITGAVQANMQPGSPTKEGPLSKSGGMEGWGRKLGFNFARGLGGTAGKVAAAAGLLAGGVRAPSASVTAASTGAGAAGSAGVTQNINLYQQPGQDPRAVIAELRFRSLPGVA